MFDCVSVPLTLVQLHKKDNLLALAFSLIAINSSAIVSYLFVSDSWLESRVWNFN